MKESRPETITTAYFALLDQHLAALVAGEAIHMLTLSEMAAALHISAKHLSQTIRLTKGRHPCYFYDNKILEVSRQLLLETDWPVATIADRLTYDPSNFNKFFKKYTGETPGQFRQKHRPASSGKIPKSSP
ncbi:helix-turn-helix domain-containing protein [Chitinophaga nivalis]|uniref:Helix-turn-helix transcriptional regulator n=1 Tax=Chitinophaga nivalis TaxID=2991709 RepID=A0ABT3IH05_9BACT|nr:helix-turn-helix transcriptional regulator [Chitinophaga nivalis]MCW3467077.1 helix-turn-helix transcriptional regulator [Chitinophaga nivalis]MCW3483232.1 helix-turn-helix transcriptional regulator [Chitinophaga nivalis]